MKDKKLPISLERILVNVADIDSPLHDLTYDCRHDFVLTPAKPMMAVNMVFTNMRCLSRNSDTGIRRKVIVTLQDAYDHTVNASATALINIRRGMMFRNVHVGIVIDFKKVNFAHPYAINVIDEKSGKILGEREIHFFSKFSIGSNILEILKPVYAGIEPEFSLGLYKSFDADLMTYQHIRFHIVPEVPVPFPAFLPEMEVRTYFPDGTVESKFVTLAKDEDDAYPEIYRAAAPIFMTEAKKGVGYAELICFDNPIAGFVFNTDGDNVYGPWYVHDIEPLDGYSLYDATKRFNETIDSHDDGSAPIISNDDFEKALEEFISSQQETDEEDSNETTETSGETDPQSPRPVIEETVSPLKALENLTGLRSVKEKLQAYEKLVLFNQKRQRCELPALKLPLHAMFLGSPGTGKTTVAKRMGLMLRRAGVLSKGHVVVKERATLLGPYYSNEETNTLQAIEDAQGGILFIDEAYQLYQPNDPRDPGRFVIEALMTALADESKRDWMLILAGYTDEMKKMFEMNPGLKSRIPESNIYIFDDFTEDELMEIAERYLERNSYSLTHDAKISLASRLGDDYRNRDRSFGNARHVINLIQTEILPLMASRVLSEGCDDAESLSLICPCDIPGPKRLVEGGRHRIGYRA